MSVYYDTPRRLLRKNGITLRLRKLDGRLLQTVKAHVDSFPRRQEWEREVNDRSLDFKATEGTPLDPLLSKRARRQLRPVFETRVRRGTISLEKGASKIEVSLDRGQIRGSRLHSPIREVELELKDGDPADLFQLAREIAKISPVRLAVLSKAEVGYRLVDHEKTEALRSDPIVLCRKLGAAETFRDIANSCLRQVVANEESVTAGQPEGVHQMRIGLRRLRTALAFFSQLTNADPKTERIKNNLKWITGELSPARDLDVYLQKSVQPVECGEPPTIGSYGLARATERRRKAAFLQAREAVCSKRYREIIIDVIAWINAGAWLTDDNERARAQRGRPIFDFVRDEMSRRTKKLGKKNKKLKKADARTRHKIRINAKKLRYASEFFASIFPSKKATKQRRAFAKSLKRLQSSLGDLNDFKVHDELNKHLVFSKRINAGRGRRRRAFAAGVIAGNERSRSAPLLKTAKRALRDVATGNRYWRK